MSNRNVWYATETPGMERIVYHARSSLGYRTWVYFKAAVCLNPFLYSAADELVDSKYLTVYENKIEFNDPQMCCCHRYDAISVVYYDRDIMQNAEKAGCCSECHPCPTCFDLCGEGVIISGSSCCSMTHKSAILPAQAGCCLNYALISNLENAEAAAMAIKKARMIAERRSTQGLGPWLGPAGKYREKAADIDSILDGAHAGVHSHGHAPHQQQYQPQYQQPPPQMMMQQQYVMATPVVQAAPVMYIR